jgi:hypothetical protein
MCGFVVELLLLGLALISEIIIITIPYKPRKSGALLAMVSS